MNTREMVMAFLGTVLKVLVVILVIVFVYKGAVVAYDYGYRIFEEPPVSDKPGIDISVEVTMGKSVMQIGEQLEAKGLIRDAKLFYIQNLLSHYKNKLRAGSYTLNTSMTMVEMMEIMSAVPEEDKNTETDNTDNVDTEDTGAEDTGSENDS